jgi:hypothetical protein
MYIFNIHTNIQENKRPLTQKLLEELAGQMTYPIRNIYYQIKGQNSSKRGQNSMKFYYSLEILTNKACVTNPSIPSPARLRCTYGVFLGNFGWWPYGATTAAVLQQFLFSRRRGAVQGTGKF